MRRIIQILGILILPILCAAQVWVARYNGQANSFDDAYAIAVDTAGNVYITGRSPGIGSSYDYATVMYDAAGVEQWSARYDGPGHDIDEAWAISVDNYGNAYVTGGSKDVDTYQDYATVKYNSSGQEHWVRRYSGAQTGPDHARRIAVDNACNVYVTGGSYGTGTGFDYATVKYDSTGALQWVARYNGPGNDFDHAYDIAIDPAGNVYVTGSSLDMSTGYDYATVKYNPAGIQQWVARYNGPCDGFDQANAIDVDEAGNVYVTGGSHTPHTVFDYATVKYNSQGEEQWVVRYNGRINNSDCGWDIAVDDAGNTYVTGDSYGVTMTLDYVTVKYDLSGEELWVARYNGTGNGDDQRPKLAIDNTGQVYVTGLSQSAGLSYDYATVMYDPAGVEQWIQRYNGPAHDDDMAHAITLDDAGNVYVTGGSFAWSTGFDYATIKYACVGIEEQNTVAMKNDGIVSTIFSGPIMLPEGRQCRIFDIMGRIMAPDNLKPGIYFLEIDEKIVQKIIKIE